ncbi:MAG: hypothetical protein KIT33_04490 [Candidatus Kapabacteria bacterium]|nr:hypothetical protein [Ignavibacteriota bacterium]MCW5884215.1 hypothetical protein [Candidatus Kapabacteria bacterium]
MFLNLIKNNVSKSLLYILFFAGILKLSGMLLTWFWNDYLVYAFDLYSITFLESVGMLAFFYLVYSGIKFGFNSISIQLSENNIGTKPGKLPQCSSCEALQHHKDIAYINKLTEDEKERLKQAIAKCCGFQHEPTKIENSQKIKIHTINNINQS